MSLFKANRSASLATPIGSVFMPASGTDTAGASTRITNPIQSRLTACGGSIRETPQEAETGPQGPIKQMGALFKVKLELFNGNPLGWWHPKGDHPLRGDPAIADALARVTRPLYLVRDESGLAVATGSRRQFQQKDTVLMNDEIQHADGPFEPQSVGTSGKGLQQVVFINGGR